MKVNGEWKTVTKVYVKEFGKWVEQVPNDYAFIFSESKPLRKMN